MDYSAVHEVESNYSIVVVKYFYQLFIIYRIWESLDGDYSGGKQECQIQELRLWEMKFERWGAGGESLQRDLNERKNLALDRILNGAIVTSP